MPATTARIVVSITVALTASAVHAQPGDHESAAALRLRFEKAASLSADQQLEVAEAVVARLADQVRRALALAAAAREEGDVARLDCVNQPLTSLKGLLLVAEHADTALGHARAAGDKEAGDHQLTKLTLARDMADQLSFATEQCIAYGGHPPLGTTVVVTVTGVPDGDPTRPGTHESVFDSPPAASPVQ